MGRLYIFSTRHIGGNFLFQSPELLEHPLLEGMFGDDHKYYYPLCCTDDYKVVAVMHLPKDRGKDSVQLQQWKTELKNAFDENGRYDEVTYILHDRDIYLSGNAHGNWLYERTQNERVFGFIHSQDKDDLVSVFLRESANRELSPDKFVAKLERVLARVACLNLIRKWACGKNEHEDYIDILRDLNLISEEDWKQLNNIVKDHKPGNWSTFWRQIKTQMMNGNF